MGLAALLAAALLLIATAGSARAAETVLSQNWETGLGSWTASGFWHVQTNPQEISVLSPEINPDLVTLPDSGQLPEAHSGNAAAWFGEALTGTYCGAGFISEPLNGCKSSGAKSGQLVSPSFDLTGASSAILRFYAWWEIEAVEADIYDVMTVEYSTDGGGSWTPVGTLNPVNNPAGADNQSYSNNGLEQPAEWKPYLVDLSAAVGHSNVKVRFNFDTKDELFNGFRGWLIDDVAIETPFDAGAPQISSVNTCEGLNPAPIWTVHGANFVEGSTVLVDGVEDSKASITSSERIELPQGLAGAHHIQVRSPNGTLGNDFPFAAGNCAGAGPGPSGGGKHPSQIQVMCNYVVFSATDTCTATVADATGAGIIPTGNVKFSSANGGLFTAGDTCQLVRASQYSTVSSCSVQFKPPKNKTLAVSGSYSGDAKLEGSGGNTEILAATPGSGAYLQHIKPFKGIYPPGFAEPKVNLEVDNPLNGTKVEGEASISGSGNICQAGLPPDALSGLSGSGGDAKASALAARRGTATHKGKRHHHRRRVRTVMAKKVKRHAHRGKVRLALHFKRRKLVKLFHRKSRVWLVVRVTLKRPHGGTPAVVYKRIRLKGHGAHPGKGKKGHHRGGARARRASAQRQRAAPGRVTASQASAHVHKWVGSDGCSRLLVEAPSPLQPQFAFKWTGEILCRDPESESNVEIPENFTLESHGFLGASLLGDEEGIKFHHAVIAKPENEVFTNSSVLLSMVSYRLNGRLLESGPGFVQGEIDQTPLAPLPSGGGLWCDLQAPEFLTRLSGTPIVVPESGVYRAGRPG